MNENSKPSQRWPVVILQDARGNQPFDQAVEIQGLRRVVCRRWVRGAEAGDPERQGKTVDATDGKLANIDVISLLLRGANRQLELHRIPHTPYRLEREL